MQNKIDEQITDLSKKYGNDVSALVALAEREYWFACYQAAYHVRLGINAGVFPDTPAFHSLASPEEHPCRAGHALTFYHSIIEIDKPQYRLEGTPFSTFPDNDDLLNGISIYWFRLAARYFSEANHDGCFYFLYEASVVSGDLVK